MSWQWYIGQGKKLTQLTCFQVDFQDWPAAFTHNLCHFSPLNSSNYYNIFDILFFSSGIHLRKVQKYWRPLLNFREHTLIYKDQVYYSCRIMWVKCDWILLLTAAHNRWLKCHFHFRKKGSFHRKKKGSLELQGKIILNYESQVLYGHHIYIIRKCISN